jgi:hypothetical protein
MPGNYAGYDYNSTVTRGEEVGEGAGRGIIPLLDNSIEVRLAESSLSESSLSGMTSRAFQT